MNSSPTIYNKTIRVFTFITLITSCSFLLSNSAYSQKETKQLNSKLSPVLFSQLNTKDANQSSTFFVVVKSNEELINLFKKNESLHRIKDAYTPANVFLIEITWSDILNKILPLENVIFIDEKRIPKEELLVGDYDLSTNKVNAVHSEYPQWNGNSIVLSVKENKMDTTDIDLKGRYLSTHLAASNITAHAGIMSTIAAGGGNTYYQGKGAAWGATISSSSFATLLPDTDASYQQYKISVQNHSYGTGIENFYGADAAAYDQSCINNPSLLHIFSAGNSGTITSTTGNYSGIPGYANLTGSFKMAKNIITVGHIDSFNNVLPPSSRGPSYDGRIKPELVAFGKDGSSGAAALVSGISILLQHMYKEQHNMTLPPSALVRSILLNTADDIGPAGIDFQSGFGNVNAYKASKTLQAEKYFTGNVATNDTQSFHLTIPPGIKQLKLTLTWNDPAATPNASKALINDLDVMLELPALGLSWQPWVLNGYPGIDSLIQLPKRQKDSLNNAEQITLENPLPGNYVVNVIGYKVFSAPQNYFVAYQTDSVNTFKWYYPTKSDNIFPGEINTVRWHSDFIDTIGQLEYSIDGGPWQIINSTVDLTKEYYKWQVTDSEGIGRLRLNIGTEQFLSDSFTISKPLITRVGFNCPDSFLLYWNKAKNILKYQLYQLGEKYLEPILSTTDTSIVLNKNSYPSMHYSVAPIIHDKTGIKSLTFNYTSQGVGCYFKHFLVDLDNNRVQIDLELGTLYQVQHIFLEKFSLDGYKTLQAISNMQGLQFALTDPFPLKGVNIYHIKLLLTTGQVIYSQPESIHYFNGADFIIYPNPVSQNQNVSVISRDVKNARMQIFNATGIRIYEIQLNDAIEIIPAGRFSKGVYFIRILTEDNIGTSFKLVVY